MKNSIIEEYSYFNFLNALERFLLGSQITPRRHVTTNEKQSGPEGKKERPECPPRQIVGRIVHYIDQHIGDSMSLDQLSRVAGINKYKLIRFFRDETGTTPWKFVQEQRLEKAMELLKEGMPLGQVAVESGFYDQSHMTRIFQSEVRLSPKQYQEKNFRNKN